MPQEQLSKETRAIVNELREIDPSDRLILVMAAVEKQSTSVRNSILKSVRASAAANKLVAWIKSTEA